MGKSCRLPKLAKVEFQTTADGRRLESMAAETWDSRVVNRDLELMRAEGIDIDTTKSFEKHSRTV